MWALAFRSLQARFRSLRSPFRFRSRLLGLCFFLSLPHTFPSQRFLYCVFRFLFPFLVSGFRFLFPSLFSVSAYLPYLRSVSSRPSGFGTQLPASFLSPFAVPLHRKFFTAPGLTLSGVRPFPLAFTFRFLSSAFRFRFRFRLLGMPMYPEN